MDILLKIGAISICSVAIGAVIKKIVPEISLLLMVAVGVSSLFLLQNELVEIIQSMVYLSELSRIDPILLIPIFKTVSISIMTRITGELCRSAGESGLAAFVELSGTILSLVIALPLIEGVMNLMTEML